jgi:hypothetical protein|tara:strand:+ start:173 stop:319 length:147 start_codon:yes stop_codon:yes gene_type:complete
MAAYNQKDLEKWKNSLLNNQANESSSNSKLIGAIVIGLIIVAAYAMYS